MKTNYYLLTIAFFLCFVNASSQIAQNKLKNDLIRNSSFFEENKGQILDQNQKARPDVLFYGNQNDLNFFIKNDGICYQLFKPEIVQNTKLLKRQENKKIKSTDKVSTYRVDIKWIDFNHDFIVEKKQELSTYNNYYNLPEGSNPALFVKQYESIILKDVWDGIDIHYFKTEGNLETDYIVAPGANYRQIRMEINGAELSISHQKNLIIKTPFGEIREGELKVYQGEKQLTAFWKIESNNQISFDIPDYNPTIALRIDPVTRVWGTYYGGTGSDYGNSIITDASKNVYLSGKTTSTTSISSGGFQNTFGGNTDAFLVKFDSAGVRQWGTYCYGGTSSSEEGLSTCVDFSGNVFLAGSTCCIASGIASGGHQNTPGGNSDAFLVKFNNNGVRLWGTYYGGSGNDYGQACATDGQGNVFLAGRTESQSSISSLGHQNVYGGGAADAFLVKFNNNGVRQWGSYYGGSSDENYSNISVNSNDIYMTGLTGSVNNIAANGHQNTFAGTTNLSDAFLVKFNSSGLRLWGTYYGGIGNDVGYSTTTDQSGNVYLAGTTNSTTSIATGGHQNSITGSFSAAFLVKFNSSGVRLWGTYYGGNNTDAGYSVCTDLLGNVYLAGITGSSPAIIASGGFQNTYMGGGDAFLAKFNTTGIREWGTYYGGSGNETIDVNITSDASGNIYLSGETNSNSSIASNGHQNTIGGSTDAFIVKFLETFITTQTPSSISTCPNSIVSLNLVASGNGITFQWQMKAPSSSTFTNVISGGSNIFSGTNTSNLTIGNPAGLDGYSFRCIVSNPLNSEISNISVLTVYALPTIQTQPQNSIICAGGSSVFNLVATGSGLSYQWQYGINTSNFVNLPNGGINAISGTNTAALMIANTSGLSNYFFRCVINSSFCQSPVNSNAVQLIINSVPTIVSQPTSSAVCPSQTTSFTVNATGSVLIFQWQNRNGSGGTWANCTNGPNYNGSTTNNLQILNPNLFNNYQYRCVITNNSLCSINTNTVTLNVYSSPSASITADGLNLNPTTINLGDVTSLNLIGSFNATNPNIVWSPSSSLSSNNNLNTIAFPNSSTNYTASFTNTFGCTQSVSQQVNVNQLNNSGGISVNSANSISTFSIFDTIKVEIRLNAVTDIYAVYAKLKYYGVLSPYLTYIGYSAGSILGSGSSIISTPPVNTGSYSYDFGISKVSSVSGFSGTGTLYTFLFKPTNIPSSLLGSEVCFYVDNLSITNSLGASVGLTNLGQYCFNSLSSVNVWPGDLDNNKIVNTADILKIGIFYNSTGPIRNNANLQWIAQPASLWGTNNSVPNGDAFKVFADGNGDGIINNADQTSVGFNLSKIHPYAVPLDSMINNPDYQRISISGDLTITSNYSYLNTNQLPPQLELQVKLNNSVGVINNLYGISFEISVDTNIFDINNAQIDYAGSIFGLPNLDFLKIEYISNGIISIGMTRFNNSSINGNGILCKLTLNTNLNQNYPDTNIVFNGNVIAANDSIGLPYSINPAIIQIPYGATASNVDMNQEKNEIYLFPNPSYDNFNLKLRKEIFLSEIKILDEIGRIVAIENPNQRLSTFNFKIENLAQGIYTVEIKTENGYLNCKFVKI